MYHEQTSILVKLINRRWNSSIANSIHLQRSIKHTSSGQTLPYSNPLSTLIYEPWWNSLGSSRSVIVFPSQFCFIRSRGEHLGAIEWSRCSRFTFLENTIGNSPKVARATFLWSDGRTLLEQLLVCLSFILDSEDLFCWYKQKSDFYELW